MKDRLDACTHHLKDEIRSAEAGLTRVGQHLSSAVDSKVSAIETRLEQAVADHEARNGAASQAIERVKAFIEEKKSSALSSLEDWKTDREVARIERHADKCEREAVDALLAAGHAILEAEIAVLDALRARKTAIEVAG